jgi:hypothetical protein
MRYRIQATIEAVLLPHIVELLYVGDLTFDPELKIYPIVMTEAEAAGATYAQHSGLQRVEPKPKRAKRARLPNNRQILVEAALKTGPKRWSELRTALSDGGLSESSLNSLITKWQKEGKIRRSGDGLWSLNDEILA